MGVRDRGVVSLATVAVLVGGLAMPAASAARPPAGGTARPLAGGTVRATYAGGLAAFVTVQDHGHRYLFQVDTGASSSAVTSGAAAALGLTPSGAPQSVDTIGCRTSVREAELSGWRVGRVALPSTRVGIVNNSLSHEKIAGMRVSGLLGSDVLARFGVATFELASGHLKLGGQVAGSRAGIPMRVIRRNGSVTEVVRATIGRHASSFVLDTGSPTTVLPASVASRAGLRTLGSVKVHGAVGCSLTVRLTQITEWSAGGQALPSTAALSLRSAGLGTSAKGPAVGLIGAETLFGFGRPTVDFTQRRLILGSPADAPRVAAPLSPLLGQPFESLVP